MCEEADYYPETTFSPEDSSDAIEKAGKFIEKIKEFFEPQKSESLEPGSPPPLFRLFGLRMGIRFKSLTEAIGIDSVYFNVVCSLKGGDI
jgi:hypothetical protein